MGLDLKNSCRLCLNKEGEFHNLFSYMQGEITLADELKYMVNFQIIKEDHLSDSICSNCYKLNSFFKEFRIICAQVNDYISQLNGARERCVEEVSIKVEVSDDDYEINGANDPSKLNGDGLDKSEDCLSLSQSTPPVSAFRSKCNEHFNELRLKFINVQGLRDALATKIETAEDLVPKYSSSNTNDIGRNGYGKVQGEIADRLSKSGETRERTILLRNDLYESNQNSLLTGDISQNSGSNSPSAITTQTNLYKLPTEYPKEDSESSVRSVQLVRNDVDSVFINNIAVDLSAPPVEVQIKQEEGEIMGIEDDDFMNGQVSPYPHSLFDSMSYGPSPASLPYYLSPENRMNFVKNRKRFDYNPNRDFKRETPEQRSRRLEKDRLRKQQKRKLETAEERRMRLEYDRIRQQKRRARERHEMNISQAAYSGIINYSCSDLS